MVLMTLNWTRKREVLLKRKGKKIKRKREHSEEKEEAPAGVFFIQHTSHITLAKKIREKLEKIEESSAKIKIKIVEIAGI